MKLMLALLISNIFSIVCVIGAVFLSYYDKVGWGWLLFLSVLGLHSLKGKD